MDETTPFVPLPVLVTFAAPSDVPFAGPVPTEGWTVPGLDRAPRTARPVRGSKVMLGGGLAIAGHALALVAMFVVGFFGSVDDSGWLVIVAIEALLFLACFVCGIVWVVGRDRGIGIGLLVGWPVGLLVPAVLVGFWVLGMVAPISAVFEAEVP